MLAAEVRTGKGEWFVRDLVLFFIQAERERDEAKSSIVKLTEEVQKEVKTNHQKSIEFDIAIQKANDDLKVHLSDN